MAVAACAMQWGESLCGGEMALQGGAFSLSQSGETALVMVFHYDTPRPSRSLTTSR